MLTFSGIWEKYYNKQILPFFGMNILKKSYHNQKFQFNSPFFSFNNFIFDILWNMEYSKILPPQDTFSIFGIWNIPKQTGIRKILKLVEYGIFGEYSYKFFKKSKYPKFWNMEYSKKREHEKY